MTKISRRAFLCGSGAVVASAGLTPGVVYWFEKYYGALKKFWAVGENLKLTTGLRPIVGQPGLFRDIKTRQLVNARDFFPDIIYDTVLIPANPEPDPDSEFIFFQPPRKMSEAESDVLDKISAFAREKQETIEVVIDSYLHGTWKKVKG